MCASRVAARLRDRQRLTLMQQYQKSNGALPYEVLRKQGGAVALSLNAGRLLPGTKFTLFDGSLYTSGGYFEQLPADVIAALSAPAGILVFEVSPGNIHKIHEVKV